MKTLLWICARVGALREIEASLKFSVKVMLFSYSRTELEHWTNMWIHVLHSVLLFFFQLYNCFWVLACSIISFHCFLSCGLCFQLVTPHLPQIIPHIVFPSYSWPSLRSCCIQFPFVYGLSHSFISHSFYMSQPAAFCINSSFLTHLCVSFM